MSSPILDDFDLRADTYGQLCKYLELLLPKLLSTEGIHPHKIECRIKSRESLEEKIGRPGKNYSNLDDITDICGARIITYFAAEVDAIATLLEHEFEVDRANSTDKRIYADPDRFGYVSLHYVVSLSPDRLKLTDCREWKGYKAEIQIRTIIQHAWAEIEHDLGFKSEIAIPREVKRRFARLAAILETADDEFAGIKKDVTDYRQTISTELKKQDPVVAINGTSVCELISSDPLVLECETTIAQRSGRPIGDRDKNELCSILASYLHFVGITTVAALHKTIRANKTKIIDVAVERLSKKSGPMGLGISLLYTCYAVLAATGDVNEFIKFFHANSFGSAQSLEDVAAELIESFEK